VSVKNKTRENENALTLDRSLTSNSSVNFGTALHLRREQPNFWSSMNQQVRYDRPARRKLLVKLRYKGKSPLERRQERKYQRFATIVLGTFAVLPVLPLLILGVLGMDLVLKSGDGSEECLTSFPWMSMCADMSKEVHAEWSG
jgi:hypothetical protein